MSFGFTGLGDLESARYHKKGKQEYQQILSEFDQLGVPCFYNTIEMSVLGHYLASSPSSLQNCVNFIQKETVMMKSHCRKILDLAAVVLISSSRRIFMVRDCQEWLDCYFILIIILFFFFNCFPCYPTCKALFCPVCGQDVYKDSPHVTLFICPLYCTCLSSINHKSMVLPSCHMIY